MRRVVTGHNAAGKSIVASDTEVEAIIFPLGSEFLRLWEADTIPAFPDDGSPEPTQTYFPSAGGFRFGAFTIPPQTRKPPENLDMHALIKMYEEKLPGLLGHMEKDRSGFHTSDTIDFEYIISGEIWLELDGGKEVHLHSGDTVIQNGTRHAWRNKGTEPCCGIICMIGAIRKPQKRAFKISIEKNKELIRKLYDLWNNKEFDAAQDLIDSGYCEHYPDGKVFKKDEAGLKILKEFFSAFPDIVSTIEDMVAEGDKVAIRVTWQGTHLGQYMGIPATGNKIRMTNSAIFRIENRKVAESWVNPDAGLMQQIGAMPKQ